MKTRTSKILSALFILALAVMILPALGMNNAQAATQVDTIFMTVTAPSVGASPAFGFSYGPPSQVEIVPNTIQWVDETAKIKLSSTDQFKSGHSYSIYQQFYPKSGYTFGTDFYHINVKGQVNGNAAEILGYSTSHVAVKYVFPALPKPSNMVDVITIYNVDEPKIGRKPDFAFNFTDAIKVYLNSNFGNGGFLWEDITEYKEMKATDTFQAGHQYRLRVEFYPKSGYTFGTNFYDVAVIGKVNGETAETRCYSTSHVGIVYDFPTLPKAVENITITGVTDPVLGAHPVFKATVSGEGAALENYNGGDWKNGVYWMGKRSSSFALKESDVFEADAIYTVRISVIGYEGTTFVDADGNVLTKTATVNGHPASIRKNDNYNLLVEYQYPALGGGVTKAGNAVITGIDAPQAGKTPDYTASVSGEGLSWESDFTDDHSWKNGIEWYDITKGEDLFPTDTFVEGHAYRVRISLIVADGYTATEGTSVTISGTINGNPAKSVYWKDTNIGFSYEFPAISAEHLFPVDFYGFAPYGGGLFLVYQGDVLTEANGLVQDPNNPQTWYFCANGQAQLQYTGLAEYNGAWFYLENGICDTNRLGIVSYNGGRFVVSLGRWVQEYSGLFQDPVTKKWYFVAAGQVQDHYTGLAQYDGAWFYLIKGELAETYTGPVEYNGSTFNVVAGMVQ